MKLFALATIAALLTLPACDGGDDKTTTDDATTGGATGGATEPTTTTPTTTTPTTTDDTTTTTTTTTTDDSTSTGEMTTAGALSFATDVYGPILSMRCNGCHIGGSSGGLAMGADEVSAYAALVDIKSSTDLDYIEPGDASQSYLWHKISGTQTDVPGGAGSKMPLGGSLTADEIATIEQWIDGGAAM